MKSRHWVRRKTDLQRRSPVKTPAPLAKAAAAAAAIPITHYEPVTPKNGGIL
jgi:hypothetical protein